MNMIEKVARAIDPGAFSGWIVPPSRDAEAEQRREQNRAKKKAKAAIKAMRKPTEAMVNAAKDGYAPSEVCTVRADYRAMIDAALGEETLVETAERKLPDFIKRSNAALEQS